MGDFSIEVITTDLPGNYGHAGVQVVDSNGNVVASVHGGPQQRKTPNGSPGGGFVESAFNDSVPLVVNMGGGTHSLRVRTH